jgi:hypothetical protein
MRKFLVIGVMGILCGIGAVSCGNDPGFEAVLVMPNDIDFGDVANATGVTTTGPVLIKVQKSDSDTTPVPHANVTIYGGGVAIDTIAFPAILFRNPTLIIPDDVAGDGFVWKTKTDEAGTIRVFPAALTDCGTSTAAVSGNINMQVVISADAATWTGTFNLTCP